ncbi:MAG: hypothetical protein Q9159_002416 [Coniocarpon cinnabarinum]
MSSIPVTVQHGAQKHKLDLDPSANGETFKYQVYSVTGVEPDRQKILVKGGQLKDDADLSKLGIKANQVIRMMGTPAAGAQAIQKPKEEMKFLEDMSEAEAARSEGATPAGLQNLGNTCYLNSTLQTLRAVPELQNELLQYKPSGSGGPAGNLADLSQFGLGGLGSATDLTTSLRDLYKQMSETQEGFPPLMFLNAFRQTYPQFAERSRDGRGFAQQDAEEAWSQIITTLRTKLKPGEGSSQSSEAARNFIDQYMAGTFTRSEECTDPAAKEAGEEPQEKPDEQFLKLNCYVASKEINHLREGVQAALTETYTKNSPTLSRDAEYKQISQIARLPKYLPVHFVRFFWKTGVNKKAKILRKVTFPQELDCVEYCTDDLQKKLIPVRDKVRDLRKEELDVDRARKRQKRMQAGEEADRARELKADGPSSERDLAKDKKNSAAPEPASSSSKKTVEGKVNGSADVPMADGETFKTDAEIEAERAASILASKKALLAAVNPELHADAGANQTGLYELHGVVTHQGASADSGHYTAYVRKEGKVIDEKNGKREDDNKWWWFNDDKVSEVDAEKVLSLSGGGESHSALILLYRAVELPVLTKEEQST